MAVFVLDRKKKPLMPCSEKRARMLLQRRRARLHRLFPFTIRLVDRTVGESERQPIRIKIDPGSRFTGGAIVREDVLKNEANVVHLAEIEHRKNISLNLATRAQLRSGRRGRKTRYRKARFFNRTRPQGWLAPSLRARIEAVESWVKRYQSL